jgi:DNA-binding XRE family transcriptional regulator
MPNITRPHHCRPGSPQAVRPALGRPLADTINDSTLKNLKELRPRIVRLQRQGEFMNGGFVDWDDVRTELLTPQDEAESDRLKEVLLAEVRAWRLAEARKRRHLTQAQVAAVMGVRQSRVSAIEHGRVDASEIGTITS